MSHIEELRIDGFHKQTATFFGPVGAFSYDGPLNQPNGPLGQF